MNINVVNGGSTISARIYKTLFGLIFTIGSISESYAEENSILPNNQILPKHSRTRFMRDPVAVEGERAVGGLPFSNGRKFATLDAYIAYLKKYAAPIDRAWYREIRPDIYRLETGNLRNQSSPRIFTRKDLEAKFGFTR